MEKNKDLRNLFYDIKTEFSSLEKFYMKVKEHKLPYTKQQVKEFYESQAVKQV